MQWNEWNGMESESEQPDGIDIMRDKELDKTIPNAVRWDGAEWNGDGMEIRMEWNAMEL